MSSSCKGASSWNNEGDALIHITTLPYSSLYKAYKCSECGLWHTFQHLPGIKAAEAEQK